MMSTAQVATSSVTSGTRETASVVRDGALNENAPSSSGRSTSEWTTDSEDSSELPTASQIVGCRHGPVTFGSEGGSSEKSNDDPSGTDDSVVDHVDGQTAGKYVAPIVSPPLLNYCQIDQSVCPTPMLIPTNLMMTKGMETSFLLAI